MPHLRQPWARAHFVRYFQEKVCSYMFFRKAGIQPTSLQGHLDSVHLLHPEPSKPTSWWAQNPPRLPSGDLWWHLQQSFSTQVTLQSHQVIQNPGDPLRSNVDWAKNHHEFPSKIFLAARFGIPVLISGLLCGFALSDSLRLFWLQNTSKTLGIPSMNVLFRIWH